MNEILKNIKKYDKSYMNKMIMSFPNQIEDAFKIIDNFKIETKSFNSVLICGMGGSAIAGDICKEIIRDYADLFIYVNRDYELPKWVTEKTLVIISSYSGNTEETISCYKESIKRKIKPIIISTGGFLLNEAIKNNQPYLKVPMGFQPRAAIGYSISLLMLVLNKIGIVGDGLIKKIKNSISVIEKQNHELSLLNKNNQSLELAKNIYDKSILIYINNHLESIGLRFRCQLAENSKILSSHFTFPEQNHNEIEAFENMRNKNLAIIWIKTSRDSEKIKNRMNVTSQILLDCVNNQYDVEKSGKNNIEIILTLINFFDWVSYYCAIFNKVDPSPVSAIKKLKSVI